MNRRERFFTILMLFGIAGAIIIPVFTLLSVSIFVLIGKGREGWVNFLDWERLWIGFLPLFLLSAIIGLIGLGPGDPR